MDTLFTVLLLAHILGAICGLGATFASPFIMKGGTTVTTAKSAHAVNQKVEKLAKIGSFTLLGTGLAMGIMHTYLFSMGWYIISITLYIAVQPVVAYLLPKYAKEMVVILEETQSDELPQSYGVIAQKTAPLNIIAQLAVFVIVFFMVFKPF